MLNILRTKIPFCLNVTPLKTLKLLRWKGWLNMEDYVKKKILLRRGKRKSRKGK